MFHFYVMLCIIKDDLYYAAQFHFIKFIRENQVICGFLSDI